MKSVTTRLKKQILGKPYLIDYPKFHVNHSHSQQHYALASSQQIQDLGVDVEDLDRKVRFEALAKHAFSSPRISSLASVRL